jgi:hypothetical protein
LARTAIRNLRRRTGGLALRRFRIPEIVLGALLAVAIFAIGTSVQIINPKNDASETGSADSPAPISAPKTTQETEAEVNRRIADYNRALDWLTFGLVVANIALWWVTWRSGVRQSRDMRESVDIAKRSAEAAQKSAEIAEKAFTQLERPYVSLLILAALNLR